MSQMAISYETRAREAGQRAAVVEDVLKRGRLSASVEDANAADSVRAMNQAEGNGR
jgi:hypothetical protein